MLGKRTEIIHPTVMSTTSPPFRLLDLPLEFQRIIFGYALYAGTILHTKPEVECDGDVLMCPATNILRVSSEIKEETLPIFYQVNRFHCEQLLEVDQPAGIDRMPPLPPIFLRSLHMITYISLQAFYYIRHRAIPLAVSEGSVLANALIHIERHAPSLRTLALHFAPLGSYWPPSPSYYVSVNDGSTIIPIITALCHLRARLGRLSLVYYGGLGELEALSSNIAPREEWTARKLDSWPVTRSLIQIDALKHWQGMYAAGAVPLWELSLRSKLDTGDSGF